MTEDEARLALQEFIRIQQMRLQTLLKPYIAELVHLEARRPPRPVILPDGRVSVYVGPTATDIGGPYVAPKWLEELAFDDPDVRDVLTKYRRSRAPSSEEAAVHRAEGETP
jgi:hypothetical protein